MGKIRISCPSGDRALSWVRPVIYVWATCLGAAAGPRSLETSPPEQANGRGEKVISPFQQLVSHDPWHGEKSKLKQKDKHSVRHDWGDSNGKRDLGRPYTMPHALCAFYMQSA